VVTPLAGDDATIGRKGVVVRVWLAVLFFLTTQFTF
jgi:hypothetical protein